MGDCQSWWHRRPEKVLDVADLLDFQYDPKKQLHRSMLGKHQKALHRTLYEILLVPKAYKPGDLYHEPYMHYQG